MWLWCSASALMNRVMQPASAARSRFGSIPETETTTVLAPAAIMVCAQQVY